VPMFGLRRGVCLWGLHVIGYFVTVF
jgi:hypothetical protein